VTFHRNFGKYESIYQIFFTIKFLRKSAMYDHLMWNALLHYLMKGVDSKMLVV